MPDSEWRPLVATPCHPEYPAGHPAQNGAAASVLLSHFADAQRFTLTTRVLVMGVPVDLEPLTYDSISQARTDGNDARVWGGMHYPSTVSISDGVGAAIAEYVNAKAMQRIGSGTRRCFSPQGCRSSPTSVQPVAVRLK